MVALIQAATHNPDLIVVEFGDGLLGEYGVEISFSRCSRVSSAILRHLGGARSHVLGGGVQILSKWGLDTAWLLVKPLIMGSGIHAVRRHTGVVAGVNARNNPDAFVEEILHHTLPSVFKQRLRA